MEVFNKSDSPHVRFLQGFRTAAALEQSPFKPESARMFQVATIVRSKVRGVEDAEVLVTMAIARRNQVSFNLLDTTQLIRARMAKSPEATKRAPYILVFKYTMKEFRDVATGEVLLKYGKLVHRIEDNLPPKDPVRVDLVPVLRGHLRAWPVSEAAVLAEQYALDQAKIQLDKAIAAFDEAWNDAYAVVLRQVGKKAADRFFSRSKARRAAAASAVDIAPVEAPAPEVGSTVED